MQRFDGIDPMFLWQLNSEADRPDLAVILEAIPGLSPSVSPNAGRVTASSFRLAAIMPGRISTGRLLIA